MTRPLLHRALFGALASLALLLPAHAQHVGGCDTWQTSAVLVDWTDPTRTFANGAVRLIGIDTGEPASVSFHIMVTFPVAEGPGLDCRLISATEDRMGFGGISLRRTTARYDSLRGLTLAVPGVTGEGDPLLIEFTLNQADGTVTLP
jgi:hypothetical protein